MATHAKSVRDAARLLYLDGRTPVAEVARRVGVPLGTLRNWATRERWVRGSEQASDEALAEHSRLRRRSDRSGANIGPRIGRRASRSGSRLKPAAKRETMVERLYRIIEHNISILETRMSDDLGDPAVTTERDMRALGNIVRSIDKLKDLEPGYTQPAGGDPKDGSPASGIAGRAPTSPEEEDRLRERIVERIVKLRERARGSSSTR